MPRALLSVSNKTGLLELAQGLADRGFEIVSTGGTARALTNAGVAVTAVSEITGFSEMLDGRVKTLHPALHAAILARRDRAEHLAALRAQHITPIDIVVVNLYPFVAKAADANTPFHEMIEEIDIGGPSLVRAAAKNFTDVLVIVDPDDYARLLAALDAAPTLDFRFDLMRKAFAHTAAYDAAISQALARVRLVGDAFVRSAQARSVPGTEMGTDTGTDLGTDTGTRTWPESLTLMLRKTQDLRYGENPHQRAAWYRPAPAVPGRTSGQSPRVDILQGKELSFTNLLDLDAAARIVLDFEEPAAVVIKHTNPCGAAIGRTLADAYQRARDADSVAAFGGIVGLNRALDSATAEAVVSTFIEAVIAPAVDDDAIAILARKKNMRVVVASAGTAKTDFEVRSVLDGVVAQERDRVVEAVAKWPNGANSEGLRVVTRRRPSAAEWEALRFAWRICAGVKSNAVIFTDASQTLAIGAGQTSRVDAVATAVMKARSAQINLAGSVAASDAFFPFRDGLDAVAGAGATAVAQPGGSVRDSEVIAAADEQGLAMVFTGRRHFRH